MTETLVAASSPAKDPDQGRRQPSAEELEAARELVGQARDRGVALTGPDGLLKALNKTVIEIALDEDDVRAPRGLLGCQGVASSNPAVPTDDA